MPRTASGEGTRLYVGVPDLDEAAARAVASGGSRVSSSRQITPTAGAFLVVADPEGNHVGLWSDVVLTR